MDKMKQVAKAEVKAHEKRMHSCQPEEIFLHL